MDDIGEFLKVAPLTGLPNQSSNDPSIPRRSSAHVPRTNQLNFPGNLINLPFAQQNLPGPFGLRGIPVRYSPDVAENSEFFWNNMSAPGGQGNYALQPLPIFHAFPELSQEAWHPAPHPPEPSPKRHSPALLGNPPSRSSYHPSSFMPAPAMPILVDAREEDLDVQPRGSRKSPGTLKHQKGRQRGNGALSAHAVYARLNRERKKTYLAELETYKTVMIKRQADTKKNLESIRTESEALIQEISSLRNELVSNDTLMSLLTMRHRKMKD